MFKRSRGGSRDTRESLVKQLLRKLRTANIHRGTLNVNMCKWIKHVHSISCLLLQHIAICYAHTQTTARYTVTETHTHEPTSHNSSLSLTHARITQLSLPHSSLCHTYIYMYIYIYSHMTRILYTHSTRTHSHTLIINTHTHTHLIHTYLYTRKLPCKESDTVEWRFESAARVVSSSNAALASCSRFHASCFKRGQGEATAAWAGTN